MVDRPRLVAKLDDALARPFALVSAPAGSGKTALLTQWIASRGRSVRIAWLPLAADDAAPHAFWAEVLASLGATHEGLAALAPPPRGPLRPFLTTVLNVLAALGEPLVLVLDDLHAIGGSPAVAELEWFLENAPREFRLVAATRSDPLFRLQRLRIAGEMTELRAADLAFTRDETHALLAELNLAPADVDVLWRRTEGWAAGLKLAQLSLEGHGDPHGFVTGFAGGDDAVSDYLVAEVVARQHPETLDFLLRTSIAEGLTGGLANELTGRSDGAQMLRELARRDTFVSSAGEGGRCYRYHGLFADVLRAELARRLPHEVSGLHRRAARWHARAGSPLEALRHAVAGGDWQLAADVLGRDWLVLVMRGSGTLLHELVEQLPPELLHSDAEVALAACGLWYEQGDLQAGDELFMRACELAPRLAESRRRRFCVASTATSLYRARLQGDVEEALSAARLVLAEQWDRSVATEVRALTLAQLGMAEFWGGDLAVAGEHLQQAAGLAVECGSDFLLFISESYAAAADLREGRLGEAWRRARTAVQLAERRGWTLLPHAAIAYFTLGAAHLWRDEVAEAQRHADAAAEIIEHSTEPLLRPMVAQLRARLLVQRGDLLGALDMTGSARAVAPLPPFLRASFGMLESEVWLALGEPARAHAALAELERADLPDAAIGLARLNLARGDPGAAIRSIATFLAEERQPVGPFALVEAWLLDAIARDGIHDEEGALRSLENALDLAEPRGYLNIVARFGAPVRSLLRRRVERGTSHRAFAAEALTALGERQPAERSAPVTLLEPLSERELAVLRFLPTMLSNAEIASEMFVSVNTVKTHLKHIYRKLDVADRRDCVKRARELRLLSPDLGER